ncbi:four helix bundle protein [Thermodesulfobacteriota bacterium]
MICLDIYRITGKFPKEEIYGLTSQTRRVAVSIPSNVDKVVRKKHSAP